MPERSERNGYKNENTFSYLDLLTLIQDGNSVDEIVENAVKEMGSMSITIETAQQKIQHLFLPTYRYDEQLFDLYASPDIMAQLSRQKSKVFIMN